jgi:hypothetical protein
LQLSIYIYKYIYLLFFISSHIPAPTQCRDLFFPMRRPSRTTTLPLSFYMIPFKPNLFLKENNSKTFSEMFFYKILSDSLFNYF